MKEVIVLPDELFEESNLKRLPPAIGESTQEVDETNEYFGF